MVVDNYKRQPLEFDIMNEDKPIQHCKFDGTKALVTQYDGVSFLEGLMPEGEYSADEFERYLIERCWDKGRSDSKDMLISIGLDNYDPYEIIKKTHGTDYDDWNWYKFTGESLTWKDVNPRR